MNSFPLLGAAAIEHAISLLFTATFSGSLIFLAVFIIQIWFGNRAPRWIYFLWLLVLVRFALFWTPASPTSWRNLLVAGPSNISRLSDVGTPSAYADERNQPAVLEHLDLIVAGSSPMSTQDLTSQATINVWQLLAAAWLVGIGFLAWQLIQNVRFVAKLVRQSSPTNPAIETIFGSVKSQLKIKSCQSIRITNDLKTPAVVGIYRPTVLIPSWCQDELTEQQTRFVIAHELIHIRRRDGAMLVVSHLIAMMHWFNPVVWSVLGFLEKNRELSCDQAVVNSLVNNDKNQKSLYGRTILAIASRGEPYSTANLSSGLIGGFTGNNETKLIKQRIAMLTKPTPKRNNAFIAATFSVALVLVGFTSAQDIASQPTDHAAIEIAEHAQTHSKIQSPNSHSQNVAVKVFVYRINSEKFRQLKIPAGQQLDAPKNTLPPGTNEASNVCVKFADIFGIPQAKRPASYFVSSMVDDSFAATMDRLVAKGAATLVDEPTLVARSGHSAEFLSGGEFPLAVKTAEGDEQILFRPFGTSLDIKPIVRGNEKITLELRAELSELAKDLGMKDGTPGFRIRRVNTAVDVQPGQMFAISSVFREANKDGTAGEEVLFIFKPRVIKPAN